MRTIFLIAAAALLLVGCKPKPAADSADLSTSAELHKAPAQAQAAAGATDGSADPTAAPPSTPALAYAYQSSLEVPPDHVRGLMDRHGQACTAAGAAVCQVVGESSNTNGGRISGSLSLRATPAWLTRFRAGLDADAKAAGGRVTSTNVQTEDLSRSMVDTEAAVRAKTTLRDRLQGLLASRPGSVGDLVQLEEELAKVQGELDASQSELAMMRGRVETSTLDLQYTSAPSAISGDSVQPLRDAGAQFLDITLRTVAALVYVAAVLLPLGAVGLLGWLIVRWFRRRKSPRPGAKS